MLEGVKLARKIVGNPALAQFELEIMPDAAVEDDQLADVIASNLTPTATQPRRRRWAVPSTRLASPHGIQAVHGIRRGALPRGVTL
jgi:hypothetical protein